MMPTSKKGVELSINVMIIAVVALLVLVVLVFFLLRGSESTTTALACVKLGGVCKAVGDCQPQNGWVQVPDNKATEACAGSGVGQICCKISAG